MKNTKIETPNHYQVGGIEAIEVIRAWDLGFSLGNALKYIQRHRHKGNPIEDLKKALAYLQEEISYLESNTEPQ